jgi:curved DNA-binding protein
MRGEDHHSKIEVDLEHAYHGATLNLDLRVPQYDAHGHLSSRTRRLQVRIPKGVTTGKRIRLTGQGGAGFAGGPPGDLYLEVAIRPHHLYQVEGKDLYMNLPVAPWEAALGARVKVPTLGGPVDMTVPAGSRGGQRLRLKGRGIPVPGEAAGDQILLLQVAVPPADTPEKKALYEEMARTMRFDPRSGLGG